ncbi:MAG: glycoside hydrolase family 116 protein, partial [Tannerella sp.]|nr:glycoside hydrolase family 116 protein [Tannerella sp.]
QYTPEAIAVLEKEGPKYQYGGGCLSDGILGSWMSLVCGMDEVIDKDKVCSHLKSVHKYNLKKDLRNHANPQRPTFALGGDGGLLLCSWPNGGKLQLPFVYSDEVWTGIEYQLASHLMFEGEVEKGLDIVRTVRKRYDGRIRNPFNEYECGAWYARAMASYGLLEGLTGVRYDAVESILYIDSRIGNNFTSFLSANTGFGNVGLKKGKPFLDVKYGSIPVKKCIVSGIEMLCKIN